MKRDVSLHITVTYAATPQVLSRLSEDHTVSIFMLPFGFCPTLMCLTGDLSILPIFLLVLLLSAP
jgi:hypothetical protein